MNLASDSVCVLPIASLYFAEIKYGKKTKNI